MPATPYSNVVFSGESITQAKLQKLANNQQWLFENMPRVRYTSPGRTLDSGSKMVAGRASFNSTNGIDYLDVTVYFGNFFTAGCKPVVTATVADSGWGRRKFCDIRGLAGEIDHTGFIAHVSAHEPPGYPRDRLIAGGWLHWQAVGY